MAVEVPQDKEICGGKKGVGSEIPIGEEQI